MKILQVCPRIPFPLHDGGAIAMFNATKHLALRGHQIKVVAFGKDEKAPLADLQQYCKLSIVKHETSNNWFDALVKVGSRTPYTVSKYHTDLMFRRLHEEIASSPVDIVQIEFLHMAAYGVFLKKRYKLPIVLREHNVDSTSMKRFADSQDNPLLQWYALLQYRKLLRYEAAVCSKFDCCVMFTHEDERRLRALSDLARTAVIPAGVDLPADTPRVLEQDKSILFMASLDWTPNVDGFLWFYRHVLPLVLSHEPDAMITIIGKGEAPRLKQLAHPNIQYIGYVAEVAPFLQAAQVCIVPLFAGGGIRMKILEMFAHRKCVVSTSVGCEGIEARSGEELLVSDDPREFARHTLTALQNRDLRMTVGINARKLVEEKYDWRKIGIAFERVYNDVIAFR